MGKLYKDFDGTTADEWKLRLQKDLKGITFEQLTTTDRNGIDVKPFYTSENTPVPFAPIFTQPDWHICSKIIVREPKEANRKALTELNSGASGLHFIIDEDTDITSLLQDIELPFIYSLFQISEKAANFRSSLNTYCEAKAWDLSELDCFIEQDAIAAHIKGSKPHYKPSELEINGGNILINAGIYLNAGANSSYELACTLAHVNEYLHKAKASDSLSAVKKIHISVTTDTAFFEQIAKLRALRILLDLVLEQYGLTPKIHLHLETSNTYRSPFDSYSNLLRDSIAGMAAVIGGCDSLHITPFDASVKEENEFSKRMSRNQQLIFKEESYLNKVADVAAGSFYIETLTEQLAAQGWKDFQAIEIEGGFLDAFKKGIIQQNIETQAQQLIHEYKAGKRVLIGVNKFVNAKDEPRLSVHTKIKDKGLQPISIANEIF